jgi:hypothetical protein
MKKSIQTPLGVYTDDEAGIEMIESYANQRVIDELEKASLMDVKPMKYNGWTNRATWLFNLHYGNKINNETDFNREKNQCEEEHENLINTIGTCMWSDLIDIREINFIELFNRMSSDWSK